MIPDDTARMGFLVAARDRAPSMLYGQWKPHGWACRLARLRKPDPTLRLGNLAGLLPFRRAQDLARWAEELRRAGPLRRLRYQVLPGR